MIEDLWYKNAVIYALSVESFMDGNGDGCGDFEGLIRRLDYLESLGVDAVWLGPFQTSPNRDNGYDISDYYGVNPAYGTLGDFVEFTHGARQRGIRVIIDLDTYHRGPTENRMGRMFGSSRFMAPEEFELGAPIDERTTVFNLGRTIQQYVFDGDLAAAPLLDLAAAACRTDPSRRIQSVAELQRAWHDSFKGISSP